MRNKALALILCAVLVLPLLLGGVNAAEDSPDYSDPGSWAYFEQEKDGDVDVFLICPTVDTKSETNSFDLNDKLKARFVNALDMEKGIYDETGRMFAPYYRQMSMNAYTLEGEAQERAFAVAYEDISAAFSWYLEHVNEGRGLILAGFSQGAQMCLELLKDYYGAGSEQAEELQKNLIAVYAIGWSVTEEMTAQYPQIVPAKEETDTGVVVSFECEDGSLTGTIIIPEGTKALSINPLNWKTDSTPADRSMNAGAVMATGADPIPGLCGAYLGERGEVVVTDVTKEEYPAVINIVPDGSYHIYDYQFFFTNLKNNVAVRTAMWRSGTPFADAENDDYADAVRYVYENGIMVGTDPAAFGPDEPVTRAQFVTSLWRRSGMPAGTGTSFSDVPENAWYADAADWAASEGVVDAAGPFDPDAELTGEDCAVILWRYARASGMDVSVGEDTNILSYNDCFEIREGNASALQWAAGAGVMEGTGNGYLGVREIRTRAQAALMIMRLEDAEDVGSPLSFWSKDAPAKQALMDYIAAVTDETSADYIPVRDRIAVFDLDGTLFCETDPNYFDYTLLAYRVLDDPEYRDQASDFEREVAEKIREQNETGASFSGLEVDHGKAVASAFSGMTVNAFNDYIQEFKTQPMPSYTGMTRGEGFYLPMVQVVNYLQENDFTVYIVSGTDRLIVRGIIYNSILDVPNRQIIGSDETLVSSNQGDSDGLNYVFADGDELILGGDFLIKNLKMNKVSVIMQEIGQQPVLSFGNSTGDSSMAEFVTSANPYRSLAIMLCCDDTERENGSVSKAEKMYDLCEEFDWIPVSMKNDWKTIYGPDVTYQGK
ncbi:MAG: DUF3089 domain-containing protein [Oscillospiraceae bacterium]|nr:DUF3089 domain-containing protein [Oscillospiraceae bacterium]